MVGPKAQDPRTHHEVVSAPGQLLCHPSQRGQQGPAVAAEPVGQQVHPGHQVLDLAAFPDLVQGVVAVGRGVGQGGAEQGLEEEGREETALHAQAQVRGQNVSGKS